MLLGVPCRSERSPTLSTVFSFGSVKAWRLDVVRSINGIASATPPTPPLFIMTGPAMVLTELGKGENRGFEYFGRSVRLLLLVWGWYPKSGHRALTKRALLHRAFASCTVLVGWKTVIHSCCPCPLERRGDFVVVSMPFHAELSPSRTSKVMAYTTIPVFRGVALDRSNRSS